MIPTFIRLDGRFEEGGHVIGEGTDDEVIEFFEEELVHKVVEAYVEANAAEDAASTHSSCAEGDVEDGVTLVIFVGIYTDRGYTIVSLELGVGLRPFIVDSIEYALPIDGIEGLDGVLSVRSKATFNEGTSEVGKDFGAGRKA